MHQHFSVRQQVLVFLVVVLATYPVSLFFALFLPLAPISNILGFLALVSYIATLLSSLVRIVFLTNRKNQFLT